MDVSAKDMASALVKVTKIQNMVCDALEMNEQEFLALVEIMDDKGVERLEARCKRLLLADEYLSFWLSL